MENVGGGSMGEGGGGAAGGRVGSRVQGVTVGRFIKLRELDDLLN